jgi:hypothetical protein
MKRRNTIFGGGMGWSFKQNGETSVFMRTYFFWGLLLSAVDKDTFRPGASNVGETVLASRTGGILKTGVGGELN